MVMIKMMLYIKDGQIPAEVMQLCTTLLNEDAMPLELGERRGKLCIEVRVSSRSPTSTS